MGVSLSMFELDHVFVLCEPNAPEVEQLLAAGFVEGGGGAHRGQGTSNRLFFFDDFYLEFLWVYDEAEARSSLTAPTQLWERWSQRQQGASSFGLCFRPSQSLSAEQKPFAGFAYQPEYFPDGYSIWLAEQTIEMPMMFYMSFATPPKVSMPHVAFTSIASKLIQCRIETPNLPMILAENCPENLHLSVAACESMTLQLNGHSGKSIRFASLPLTIEY